VADTKISALTAVTAPATTDEFAVNQGGASKKETLAQVRGDGVFRALDYGTNGAAIQSALDAAGSAGGGDVIVGPGTWALGTTGLTFPAANGVRLRGAGKTATTLTYTGTGAAISNGTVTSTRYYCGVESMTITITGATTSANAIKLENMRQGTFRDLFLNSNGLATDALLMTADPGGTGRVCYFNMFWNVDIDTNGWCVSMLGNGVNRNTFVGGVWEGNSGNALGIRPTSAFSDSNVFYAVGFQTHGSTIVQLGGNGGQANDNRFIGCSFELPSGSSTITLATATGTAQRNFFLGCYRSNVLYSDPLKAGQNVMLDTGFSSASGPDGFLIDTYRSADESKSMWLRPYHAGLTIGTSDFDGGVLTIYESGYTAAPPSRAMQLRVDNLTGTTVELRAKDSAGTEWLLAPRAHNIPFIIDGGGATITTGVKGDIVMPAAGTIEEWTLLADQSGAIVVDIWKDTYANFPPTDADAICSTNEPEIVASGTKAQSSTLTGWTTTFAAGDILRFNVDSCTSIQRVTLNLRVRFG